MNLISKKSIPFFVGFIVFSVIAISVFYQLLKVDKTLPIYQPEDLSNEDELVDKSVIHVKRFHKIDDFSLTNQNGKTITQKDYQNKIYVADFFFTTCQSICIDMHRNMQAIEQKMRLDNDVLFLSHTVMPNIDSVSVLKKYATEKGISAKNWNLVTGSKREIYDLARKSYCVAKIDPEDIEFGLIHTEKFVLIDKKMQIRGIYDGTKSETVQKVIDDIATLKKEYQ